MNSITTAHRALGLLDLTSLEDNDSEESIAQLCGRAVTPFGPVAAVCVWPRFVPLCKKWLWGSGVRVATVANFPHGRDDAEVAVADMAAAVAYGADEVDLVFPYHAWMVGDSSRVQELMQRCRAACGDRLLKVILETGQLETAANVGSASLAAIRFGADFLKTSTGKTSVSATPEAARAMFSAILESGEDSGFKASGGIRTVAQAAEYLTLADEMMGPGWVAVNHFRFGASSLLNDVIAVLEADESPAGG